MDEPENLFGSLSAEGKDLAPVSIRLMAAPEYDATCEGRIVESAHHRARGYHCYAFHKPISRFLRARRP
jgi:hypothetical protein